MYTKSNKIIAMLTVLIMLIANLSTIGIHVGEVIAATLDSQDNKTNNANVEFDSFFLVENNKTHEAIKNIEEENKIVAQISVKNAGYLKNARVEFADSNFKVLNVENEKIAKVQNNVVTLNQINNGEDIILELPITFEHDVNVNIEQFNKISKVNFTATYIDENANERQIKKEVSLNLKWTANAEVQLSAEIIKYVPYDIDSEKGLIMQMCIKETVKDNLLPIKSDNIEMSIPQINGVSPKDVTVYASDSNVQFGEDSYEVENNKLTISTQNNVNENGEIYWPENSKNEYIVTCIYSEEAIQEETEINISLNSDVILYSYDEQILQANYENDVTLNEKIGDIVDFTIVSDENLSKGYMYANLNTEEKQETVYTEKLIADIGTPEFVDEITISMGMDNFDKETNTNIINTYFKNIKINKSEFIKFFGENGKIEIYSGEELIKTIDNTIKDETINVELNKDIVTIKTTKPIQSGKLTFEFEKAIKSTLSYSKEEIQSFEKLNLNVNATVKNGEMVIVNKKVATQIALVEPTTQALLTIDNSSLSTVVTNENVKLTAILKTDNLYCNLYKEPVLQIEFPSYIENVNVKNIEVLFNTQNSILTEKSFELTQYEDGVKVLTIVLQGTQTEYNIGAVSQGVNVVITADLKVNHLTPNKQDQITMTYINKNAVTALNRLRTEAVETGVTQVNINYVAPTGVITTASISNYADGAEEITTISGEEKTAKIEIQSDERQANFNMSVINNYSNTIDSVVILGRTPFEANKDIITGEDLGSTITMPLSNLISVSGIDESKVSIYYSENGDATKDLTLDSNAWTESPENLANVKSYLITLNDVTMNTADAISFGYTAQIPANLQHNASAYETYVVYFNNNLETGKVQDRQVAAKLGVSTGAGPELQVKITSNVAEDTIVTTGKFIKYTVTVKNIGKQLVENAVATVDIPEGLNVINFLKGEQGQYEVDYSNQVRFELGNIEIGQTVTKDFWVVTNIIYLNNEDFCTDESHYIEEEVEEVVDIIKDETGKQDDVVITETKTYRYHNPDIEHHVSEYFKTISLAASVTAKDLETAIISETVNNTIKNSVLSIYTSTTENGIVTLNEGDEFEFNISVRKNDDLEVKNAIVTYEIPDGLTYKNAQIEFYDATNEKMETSNEGISYNSGKVTVNLGEITSEDTRTIIINAKVEKLANDVYEKNIVSIAKVVADGIEETSNPIIDTISKEGFSVTQTTNIPENSMLTVGEKLTYKISVKNLGGNAIGSISIEDNLPKELQYVNTEYTIDGETKTTINIDDNNKTKLTINIPKGQTAEIRINVIVGEVEQDTTINNTVNVTTDKVGTITSNTIIHKIEAVDYEKIENETPDNNASRKISGQIWLDENNDGIKSENETKISGVEVRLYDNNSATFVKDSEGNELLTTTDQNGTYTFRGLAKGSYTVIFLYDTSNYSATNYKTENADEEINSDAIDSSITIDGKVRIAGITEAIIISDSNIYNIDLGLVKDPKFDLSLNKKISKIILQDSTGTNVTEYSDVNIAKKEIESKKINDTTVVIEYKITVTNEGAIGGYVKKIADYMPTEMKFLSEINKDWYADDNGTLYNSSLSNTLIKPGESKTVTLTLTKKLSENNLGLYSNTAEIYETYNDLGLKDIDSTAGNKISNEDDISTADVVISVKTGETILFIGLTLGIIAVLGTATYFIRKKVLR